MNIAILSGHLARDAETRHTPSGKSVTSFTIANSIGWGDNQKTMWVRCSAWGDRYANLAQYLTKGKKITVSGEISMSEWEKDGVTKSNMELNVRELDLPARDSGQQEPAGSRRQPPAQDSNPIRDFQQPQGTPGFDDTDLPF